MLYFLTAFLVGVVADCASLGGLLQWLLSFV